MMAALRLLLLVVVPAAWARSIPASDRPAPNAPILRKLRRLMPSQKRCFWPKMVNIEQSPLTSVSAGRSPGAERSRGKKPKRTREHEGEQWKSVGRAMEIRFPAGTYPGESVLVSPGVRSFSRYDEASPDFP